MTNSEIEAFLSVCKYNSISKAAEKLFISQSSLSTKIKTLEREIGCPLMIRSKGTRTVSLTDEGREFLELAVKYEEIVSEMFKIGKKSAPSKLRVSTLNSTGTYLFTPVYERFMLERPDTVLEIQDMATTASYNSMEIGFTDMAFTVGRLESKKVITYPAFTENMVLICAASSKYSKNVDIEELDVKNEVYINWFDDFEQWHKDTFGESAAPLIKLELMSQLEFFLTKKNTWAFVPSSAAYWLTRNEYIKKCDISFEIPKRITYCSYIPNKSKEDAMNCFLDCLKRALEGMDGTRIEIYI
ncbi:MAG: LysR family transcriptional regulator [Clostridiales bacterium]|nr:LysR family transcriptional regulator [Clostridiales bacterium]